LGKSLPRLRVRNSKHEPGGSLVVLMEGGFFNFQKLRKNRENREKSKFWIFSIE